jgi:hypothetical protein
MTSQATNRREGGFCHATAELEALRPHVERARDREGGSKTA